VADVSIAGPQGAFGGLDQVNLSLSSTLAGLGKVDIALDIDGAEVNIVQIYPLRWLSVTNAIFSPYKRNPKAIVRLVHLLLVLHRFVLVLAVHTALVAQTASVTSVWTPMAQGCPEGRS
jgi:hypothetical protein